MCVCVCACVCVCVCVCLCVCVCVHACVHAYECIGYMCMDVGIHKRGVKKSCTFTCMISLNRALPYTQFHALHCSDKIFVLSYNVIGITPYQINVNSIYT